MNTLLEELNVPRKQMGLSFLLCATCYDQKWNCKTAYAPLEHQQRESTGDITE